MVRISSIIMIIFFIVMPLSLRAFENTILSFPVVLNQDTLFFYSSDLMSFSASERAIITSQRINSAKLNWVHGDSLYIIHSEIFSEIFLGGNLLITVSDIDALKQNTSRDSLAHQYMVQIQQAFSKEIIYSSYVNIIKNTVFSFFIVLFAFCINWIILKFSYKVEIVLMRLHEKKDIVFYLFSKFRMNFKSLINTLIFFYNGIKMILIATIVVKSISFLLKIVGIRHEWVFDTLLTGIYNIVVLTVSAYYLLKINKHFLLKLYHIFNNSKLKIIKKIQHNTFTFITEDKLIILAKYCVKLLYLLSVTIVSYFYITILFSFFSFTETWADMLIGFIVTPIQFALHALISYLPNIFIILIIIFLIKYLLKLIKFIFSAIENKAFTVPGFYSDWAMPTFKIVRFMVIIFAVIVIFPYLPGSNSPFFKGITVFIGVLFSLGSTSAIANVIAGVVLTYMRPFKVGDRVKIAETMGDIVEKSLLVTRVRTTKNVDITVPNAMVLSSHIINYSSSSQQSGLIIHSIITMGYEIDWRIVHELLIESALITHLILKEPKPYVYQTVLDDFYVKYEINAYTKHPEKMTSIYSELHQNIQDVFGKAGLELMSPIYSSLRDGNKSTVPEQYLGKNYKIQGFKIEREKS